MTVGICQETAAVIQPNPLAHKFPPFNLPEAGPVTLAWTNLTGLCSIALLDVHGSEVAGADGSDSQPNGSLSTGVLGAGTYQVAAANLDFSIFPSAPTVGIVVRASGCGPPAPGGGGGGLAWLVLGAAAAGTVVLVMRSRRPPTRAVAVPAAPARRAGFGSR